MNFLTRNKKEILTYLLLTLLISLTSIFKVIPYLHNNYYFLIGFDSGKYVYDLKTKTSSTLDNLDLWTEPGLNTNLVVLNSLISINPILIYKFVLPIFVSIFFILIVYVYTREISNSYIAGIFSSIYFSTSVIFLNATFDSYYRQIFGTIIYMVFFFYVYKIYKLSLDYNYKYFIFLGILGAGIIISHRAISLLFIITLFILFVQYVFKKEFNKLKYIILMIITSLAISSVYWVAILNENLIVMKEAFLASFSGKSGGNTTIRKITRSDNQIVGYFTTIPLSFLPFISIVYVTIKNRIHIITPFLIILLFYIYVKASFSNRFLFNLEIIFSIILGVYFNSLRQVLKPSLLVFIVTLIFTFGVLFNLNTSLNRKPYLNEKTNSILWIEKNIDQNKSIFFAPDALSTILTESGYDTAFYKYPIKLGSGVDIAKMSESILINGCKNKSIIKGIFNKNISVYIAFDNWNISNPLPRVEDKIPLKQIEKCEMYEKVYNGDSYIVGIYKFKKEYQ